MRQPADAPSVNGVRTDHRAQCARMARVLVAVRHPVMRRYAAELLGLESPHCVSTVTTGAEVVASAIRRSMPDVLVVDADDFPGCCQVALASFPRDRVIVIGPEPRRELSRRRAGEGCRCMHRA